MATELSVGYWLKAVQFRRVRQQADRFFDTLERTSRLEDAYHAAMKLPPSPYGRLLREGVNFFSELMPGALTQDPGAAAETLTPSASRSIAFAFAASARDMTSGKRPVRALRRKMRSVSLVPANASRGKGPQL